MYRKILVPLDGSTRAEAILPHVEHIAQSNRAEILLLQVVEPLPVVIGSTEAPPAVFNPDELARRQQEIERYLAGWEERLREKGLAARWLVAQGPVVQTIIEVAEREDADLIAMASHGRSGLTRVFYGSVASGVLQRVDRPLLLIRARDE